ncbi:hypothetical protein CLOP_g19070, partial [Closterium sp. NIES-67]
LQGRERGELQGRERELSLACQTSSPSPSRWLSSPRRDINPGPFIRLLCAHPPMPQPSLYTHSHPLPPSHTLRQCPSPYTLLHRAHPPLSHAALPLQ